MLGMELLGVRESVAASFIVNCSSEDTLSPAGRKDILFTFRKISYEFLNLKHE